MSTYRGLTPLEGIFLQVFILLAGLGGSLWIGRLLPVNRIHARTAFRRLNSLYLGLSAIAGTIEESRRIDTVDGYRVALSKLEGLVINQLITADDALEDWRDIAPDDVNDLRKKIPNSNRNQE